MPTPETIPKLFMNQFTVDPAAPFARYLNRLEVEIGREDYRMLKRVERLEPLPAERFAAMEELTTRIFDSTQNLYNRDLLKRLRVRIYFDRELYCIYYRMQHQTIRFRPHWRETVLQHFFATIPTRDTGWCDCGIKLAGFAARFLPDAGGGALLLRRHQPQPELPLLTATHGPYDPHTLEVTLLLLARNRGDSAIINLGFAGREPLADENLQLLRSWGLDLNPSNIDVIYPYVDRDGHPFCYKMERNLGRFVAELDRPAPDLLLDIHGCVGVGENDQRIVVGLGGLPPFPRLDLLGRLEPRGEVLHLFPTPLLSRGLSLIRELSDEIYLQLCCDQHRCYHFSVLGKLQMLGRAVNPRSDVQSLLDGEERTFLPAEDIRWLPGAGANALQRLEARKLRPDMLCLHVEIPTQIRRRMVLKYRELQIDASLAASSL